MPEFVPILVVAILVFAALLITFGNIIVPQQPTTTLPDNETAPIIEQLSLGEDFTISGAAGEEKITTVSGTVSRGLITGIDRSLSFEVPNFASVSGGEIKLNIINANLYGPLLIGINGENVYADYPRVGRHVVDFGKDVLEPYTTLEVEAGSSGWRFWAPTIYKFDAEFYVHYLGKLTEKMNFELDEDHFDDDTYAELSIDISGSAGTGRLIVKANGFEIWRGSRDHIVKLPNEILDDGRNDVEISSESNSRYEIRSVDIEIFY